MKMWGIGLGVTVGIVLALDRLGVIQSFWQSVALAVSLLGLINLINDLHSIKEESHLFIHHWVSDDRTRTLTPTQRVLLSHIQGWLSVEEGPGLHVYPCQSGDELSRYGDCLMLEHAGLIYRVIDDGDHIWFYPQEERDHV